MATKRQRLIRFAESLGAEWNIDQSLSEIELILPRGKIWNASQSRSLICSCGYRGCMEWAYRTALEDAAEDVCDAPEGWADDYDN